MTGPLALIIIGIVLILIGRRFYNSAINCEDPFIDSAAIFVAFGIIATIAGTILFLCKLDW